MARQTRLATKKITFDEAGENQEMKSQQPAVISDNLDLDLDDAPEEESVSTVKKQALAKAQAAAEAKLAANRAAKEKRKQRDQTNAKQQLEKKEKVVEQIEEEEEEEEELPEFLDEEIIDAFNKPSNTHVRLDEEEEEEIDAEELRRQAKQAKLAALKQRGAAIKRGPVYVSVAQGSRRNLAPKREAAVMLTKDQWLNRKALNRK